MTPPIKARWGALLDKADLCEYLKCSGPSLDKEMALGRLPYPVKYGGRDKWRREDIDRALERLFNGSETPDWRAKLYEGRAA